jgi:hypothetical protein
MQTRVMHPDGGDRMVTSTLADEEAQRTMIASETGRGSRNMAACHDGGAGLDGPKCSMTICPQGWAPGHLPAQE